MEAKISSCWQQRVDVVIEELEKIMQSQQKLFCNYSLDAQIKLSQLSQVSYVLDYQIEFEKLSSKATEMHKLILVGLFISGLKPEIRWELQFNRPFTLKEAFVSARYHELRLKDIRLTRNGVVDDLVDSNAIIEIVENDAMFDYVETKVVENVVVKNVEVEFAKELDMLIDDDFKLQFDVVAEEKQSLPTMSNMVDDSSLSMQLIKVDDTFNYRKEEDSIVAEHISFSQLVMLILDKEVEYLKRCAHHGIIFVDAQRKIILARRMVIFQAIRTQGSLC